MPEFQGCRYLAVQIEPKNPDHPASRVARQVDGASARAGIGADHLAGLATPTVRTLLDAAEMR